MKYRFETTLKPVVEFVRKDAEIAVDLDGAKSQWVIGQKYATTEEAQLAAETFCALVQAKISELVKKEIAGLKKAQP